MSDILKLSNRTKQVCAATRPHIRNPKWPIFAIPANCFNQRLLYNKLEHKPDL